MTSKKRKEIVEAIRLTWDSLNSHLDDAVELTVKNACCKKAVGNPKFHRTSIQEYAKIIRILSDQL